MSRLFHPAIHLRRATGLLLSLAATLVISTAWNARATQVEGVDVPPQATAGGKTLGLNGAGLRSVNFFGVPVKVFVAAFYTMKPVHSSKEALSPQRPVRFDFIFLRNVSQSDVTKAWNSQFAASVTDSYPGLAKDQGRFTGYFGALSSGDRETVVLLDNNTLVYDKGALKGSIEGVDFQKAFLGMWFGSKPVMDSLKGELLGK